MKRTREDVYQEIEKLEEELEEIKKRERSDAKSITVPWRVFEDIFMATKRGWVMVDSREPGWLALKCPSEVCPCDNTNWRYIYRFETLDDLEWLLCDCCVSDVSALESMLGYYSGSPKRKGMSVRLDIDAIEPQLLEKALKDEEEALRDEQEAVVEEKRDKLAKV
jgi:hypothetical protein